MTSTFPDQHSDTRIFVLSALGSLLLHGLLITSLAYMPKVTIVKDDPPTVQVTLLPSPEVRQTPQTPTPPLQPPTAMPKAPPPPMVKPSALTPPEPGNPILRDTTASKAMKARDMMKMRVPAQTQQSSPPLPTMSTRQNAAHRVMPLIPPVKKERLAARILPALPVLAKPQTLTATPPALTGSTSTRPTIISSSRPVYPRMARESGWEGTVIIRTLIDTNGVPNQVRVRKSSGHPTLDQAAQEAVKSWTFQPAKDGNIPITKWVDIPIKFDLNS